MSEPTLRPAARVLLFDERDRLLLFRIAVPGRDTTIWLTPGGGLEDGEDWQAAAQRELWEETGLEGVTLSACVWERRHVFTWREEHIDAHERFFVGRAAGTPDVRCAKPNADEELDDYRWWSHDDIVAQARREIFVPRALPSLLAPILQGVLPRVPLPIGA